MSETKNGWSPEEFCQDLTSLNKRKVIQIKVCQHNDDPYLIALCADGTIWDIKIHGCTTATWCKYPSIPDKDVE